jgi:hypothetical protein
MKPMIRTLWFAAPLARLTRRRLALAVAVTLAATSAAPVRADNLDAALLKNAPEVIRYLHEHHYRNVGVLKFRVHKGKQPASFKVGPLNDNMVERLENALIAVNSSSEPIGIIHDANHVAATRRLARYDNPAGQRALFQQSYALAWGNTTVTPDYLLTGIVTVRPDLKSATVVLEGFGPNSPKQDKVLTFQVETDRSLLADLNESFQVKSRALKRKTRSIDLDEEAVADAAEKDTTPPKSGTASAESDSSVAGAGKNSDEKLLDFQVLYDGAPQQIAADPDNPGELRVAEPNENQAVSIAVRSVAQDRIGLVLMVNGVSTLYEEPQQSDLSKNLAWVLDPGRQYAIQGYQQDNQTRKPFRVLSAADSEAATYSANTGLIQFHILRSGPSDSKSIAGNDQGTTDDSSGQAMSISLRGLNRSAMVKLGHTRSLGDLKNEIRKNIHKTSRRSRGLIASDTNAVAGAIQNDEVKNPVFVQSIAVRYYKPKRS